MTVLHIDRTEAIVTLTLNRPASGNALNIALVEQLETAVETAVADDTRALVLAADGSIFCGGGDVEAMATAADPAEYTHALATGLHRTLLALAAAPFPLIIATEGAAAGAGLGLILNGDFVIASETASFVAAYGKLGVSPDGGTSYLLPRVVGRVRANQLALRNRRLDAVTALDWGIVSEIVPPGSALEAAQQLARDIERIPVAAIAETKRLLAASWLPGYRAHLDDEADTIARLITTEESRARQHTFLAGR